MIAHPKIVPYLNVILGLGYRMDHNAGLITMREGAEGHILHGSSGPGFDPHQYYIFRNGQMHNGLTVVAWQFADVNEGDGGLCLIPGSHKGNYPCPQSIREHEAFQEESAKWLAELPLHAQRGSPADADFDRRAEGMCVTALLRLIGASRHWLYGGEQPRVQRLGIETRATFGSRRLAAAEP